MTDKIGNDFPIPAYGVQLAVPSSSPNLPVLKKPREKNLHYLRKSQWVTRHAAIVASSCNSASPAKPTSSPLSDGPDCGK